MARATYKVAVDGAKTEFVTADKPKELYERGILAPSFIAHLLTKKFRWGMPFHRLALELASDGIELDDSTMCRYAEHVGATLGCIVDAMAKEAKAKAFCLSTDATGVAIQPARLPDGKRQACAKGHLCAAGHKCPYAEPRFMRSKRSPSPILRRERARRLRIIAAASATRSACRVPESDRARAAARRPW